MSRSCLNMRSSIQNYKDELMNELSFLHVPSEIGHIFMTRPISEKVEGCKNLNLVRRNQATEYKSITPDQHLLARYEKIITTVWYA